MVEPLPWRIEDRLFPVHSIDVQTNIEDIAEAQSDDEIDLNFDHSLPDIHTDALLLEAAEGVECADGPDDELDNHQDEEEEAPVVNIVLQVIPHQYFSCLLDVFEVVWTARVDMR